MSCYILQVLHIRILFGCCLPLINTYATPKFEDHTSLPNWAGTGSGAAWGADGRLWWSPDWATVCQITGRRGQHARDASYTCRSTPFALAASVSIGFASASRNLYFTLGREASKETGE